MSEQKPKFHQWFHNALIYFFLWAFAAIAVISGIRTIYNGWENGYNGFPFVMLIIVNGLMIVLGLFVIKVRYDLAAFRRIAVKELPGICIAGALLCLGNYWVEDIAGDDFNRTYLLSAFILVCWGISLYRYYHDRLYLFK